MTIAKDRMNRTINWGLRQLVREEIEEHLRVYRTIGVMNYDTDVQQNEFEDVMDILVHSFKKALASYDEADEPIYKVDYIMDYKVVHGDGRYYGMFLVKWFGYDEPTWEHEHQLAYNAAVDEFWSDVDSHKFHPLKGIILKKKQD